MNDKIVQLTDDSFEADVLKASGLVLVLQFANTRHSPGGW